MNFIKSVLAIVVAYEVVTQVIPTAHAIISRKMEDLKDWARRDGSPSQPQEQQETSQDEEQNP